MRSYRLILLVGLAGLLIGCAEQVRANGPSEMIEIAYENLDLRCVGRGGSQEFVINTEEEYQSLIHNSPDLHPNPGLDCVGYAFPKIDFSSKTLLGKGTSSGGCTVKFERKVLRDNVKREYIYQINIKHSGSCDMAWHSNNFILVPKISSNYTIKFWLTEGQKGEKQYCEKYTSCPVGKHCYKFEDEDKAICWAGDPCEKCESKKCEIQESAPPKVRCEPSKASHRNKEERVHQEKPRRLKISRFSNPLTRSRFGSNEVSPLI
jgi:hypothetical protein